MLNATLIQLDYTWFSIHPFISLHTDIPFFPNTHSFTSNFLVIIIRFMWICPIFHAWSALNCTGLLPNGFSSFQLWIYVHSMWGRRKKDSTNLLVVPQCPAQSVFCLWLSINKSGALDPHRWWAIKENTKIEVRCSWGQPRQLRAKTLKENIYCIDSKSVYSEDCLYFQQPMSVYRFMQHTCCLPSFYCSASGVQ